jgi:poly-gamma-glutamate synthesis protein (capsule biosynthesis protein)
MIATIPKTEITPVVAPLNIHVYIDPLLPIDFRSQLKSSSEINFVETLSESNVQLIFSNIPSEINWVYALVVPFPTVMDGVTLIDLKRAWVGDFSGNAITNPIEMTQETRGIFSKLWGEPSVLGVEILAPDKILPEPFTDMPRWALIPFESVDPKWKVLEIDGKSLLSKDFSEPNYPLALNMKFTGDDRVISQLNSILESNPGLFQMTNRDSSLFSVVMLTGTTALTRDIGKQMDAKGVLYPASDIKDWFHQADIIHISNEVSFMNGCIVGDRGKFCSKPEYLDLLTSLGTNVIELTGNHLLDFGPDPFLFTIGLYDQNHIPYYGGGSNLNDARKPLLINDHGNKIAFLGCNYGNPPSNLATATSPGANPCDSDWMKSTIQGLKNQGYLVIFTYQDIEVCTLEPVDTQRGDFFRAAEAGADIVSGSQAHCPQAVTFHGSSFIHYGLGNLFFDQMDPLSQKEMVDLHYFYNGKYISTQFLTAMLEDSAKPKPMTTSERANLLYSIFAASVWDE